MNKTKVHIIEDEWYSCFAIQEPDPEWYYSRYYPLCEIDTEFFDRVNRCQKEWDEIQEKLSLIYENQIKRNK